MNFPDPMAMANNLARGPAFTIANGVPVACGGILPLWKGVGEAWIVSSPLVEKYPITFAKVVWKKLKLLIEIMDLERVQTMVDCNHKVSQEWVKRMGFKKEGKMSKYIGGRDFYRYALVKEK
jgi:hypothetical protein